MSERNQKSADRWHRTAEALITRAATDVHCPDCGRHGLSVRDMEYGCGPGKGVQRYMMCSYCGAFQVVSLKRAGSVAA